MSTHILVCDDDAFIRRAVAFKLERAGLEVETATDGEQGWEAARRHPPAVVITDCQMPRLNGIELCQRLRAHTQTQHVKLLLLTGKELELDEQQLKRELQIEKLISKPFSPRDLLQVVQELIEGVPI